MALQLLYQYDQNKTVPPAMARAFMAQRLSNPKLELFADTLYHGTRTHRAAIDAKLAAVAENWAVERMAVVDRNILRLAVFELLHLPDTPPKVIIDEAIELAKRYGANESHAFVNGILDRIANLRGAEAPLAGAEATGSAAASSPAQGSSSSEA